MSRAKPVISSLLEANPPRPVAAGGPVATIVEMLHRQRLLLFGFERGPPDLG